MDPSVENDEAHAARRVGEVVGRYRLERVLGVGGMAAVYVGRSPEGFVAAIKILHGDMSARRDVRERFYREGYVANSVQHPGVVRVLEHGDAGADAFLAMELLSGETLAQRVKRYQSLPIAEVLGVADQVLDVLRAAHEKGIVHRDLKPDNLFVTHSGQVKILDFGLARLVEETPGDHHTRSGVALGTLPYMAPEQALGRRAEIDGRVDIFALGATLFRILSGRRLHDAPSEAELLIAMATRPAPPLVSVAPQVPIDICRIVDLALAFARDARYPNAESMQTDVRAVFNGQHPPYAFARLAHRDQKTRVDAVQPEAPNSSARGPQGTVPLSVHQANLGATLGGQAVPHQLAQTFPSAVAPHILARTIPSAGVASEPRPPAASAGSAPASLSQTYGPGVQVRDSLGSAASVPVPPPGHAFGPAVQSLSALGQTYPSAVNPADLSTPPALGKTPVEVIVARPNGASQLAQTYPSAGALPQSLADTQAEPPPRTPARAPFVEAQSLPQPAPYVAPQQAPVVPQPAPYVAPQQAPMAPQPAPYVAPQQVPVVPQQAPTAPQAPHLHASSPRAQPAAALPVPAPDRKPPAPAQRGQALLWVLAVLGLLVSAGVALALVSLFRSGANAPTPRNSSSSLSPPAPLAPRVESAQALPKAPEPTARPGHPEPQAPTVDLAPSVSPPPAATVIRKPSAAPTPPNPSPSKAPASAGSTATAPAPPKAAPVPAAPTEAPPASAPTTPARPPKLAAPNPVPLSDLK